MNISITDEIKWNHITPQFARSLYFSLDGVWKCNGYPICVPFPPESNFSKYPMQQAVLKNDWDGKLEYTCYFNVPKNFSFPRIILHFGAVDQIADVYLNGQYLGHHEGGYLAFSFDATPYILFDKENQLTVEVLDTLSHNYPYGKQRKDRGGMWYTPVSGIWKSVWIENVPELYISDLKVITDLESADISVTLSDGTKSTEKISISDPKLWTPENPFLYGIKIEHGEDLVYSYFGLRTVDIREINGISRVCLNGLPVFLNGVLLQGYWKEGIYTPESNEDYIKDIESIKRYGFNMIRMHIKVESDYFYAMCDRMGILVCQDMVQNGGYHYWFDTVFPTIFATKRKRMRNLNLSETCSERRSMWKDPVDARLRQQFFVLHSEDTLKELYNHPSIVMYTIFNEGWGQFSSDSVYEHLKACDNSRIYDATSGWFIQSKSDIYSEHVYFWTKKLRPDHRPMLLSECGGFSYPIKGHLWNSSSNYGYGGCKNEKELFHKIQIIFDKMIYPAIKKGLCGYIYTQYNDIEDEINGLVTYDREVCKIKPEKWKEIADNCTKILQQQ